MVGVNVPCACPLKICFVCINKGTSHQLSLFG